ncbi:MAG: (2Fe-2S)-binding protein [Deltaproteobacteria bacterium]|nr:(2Fe-2S)-binding protein [Deltaproteobacteria bacterium]
MRREATIIIDGKEATAEDGSRLLWAILDAGIWIPNLCAIRGVEPPHGGCRLCWVEVEGPAVSKVEGPAVSKVEGPKKPVTSCTRPVKDGMVVRTRSEGVDRLVRAGFEMLLSTHRLDCRVCPGNRRCGLQDIARLRKIPLRGKRLDKIEPDFPLDESRPELGINPNHCILCGRCVHACHVEVKKGIIDYVSRGLRTHVGTFDGAPLNTQGCGDCVRCAQVCPVGAIYLRKRAAD